MSLFYYESAQRLAQRLGITLLSSIGTIAGGDEIIARDVSTGLNGKTTVSAILAHGGLSGLTDNAVIRANGATGLQGSGLSITDTDDLLGVNAATIGSTLTLGAADQDYTITGDGAGLFLQAQTMSSGAQLEIASKNNNGSDDIAFVLDALGKPTDANYEDLLLRYDSGNTRFALHTDAGGSGSVRELRLYTGANTGQLVLTPAGNVTMAGNLTVTGQIDVAGGAFIHNATDISTQDPLVRYALDNTADVLDIGWVGEYDNGTTPKYTGMFRDASDGKYRLFSGLQAEPTTTVNTAGTGYTPATLVANLEVPASATFAGATIANLGTVTTADINGGTIDGITVFTMSGTTAGIVGPIITNASVDSGARCGFSLVNDLGFGSRTFMYRYASSASAYGLSGPLILGNLPDTPIGFVVANSLIATIESSSLTLSSGVNLTMNGGTLETGGGSIASSSGTVDFDDSVDIAGGVSAGPAAPAPITGGIYIDRTSAPSFIQMSISGSSVGQLRAVSGGGMSLTDPTGATTRMQIDANRADFSVPVQLPSYTVAGLPTGAAGDMAYCSDETGGAVPVFHDGTNWRRVTDRAIAA